MLCVLVSPYGKNGQTKSVYAGVLIKIIKFKHADGINIIITARSQTEPGAPLPHFHAKLFSNRACVPYFSRPRGIIITSRAVGRALITTTTHFEFC